MDPVRCAITPAAYAEEIATRLQWVREGLGAYAEQQGISIETKPGQSEPEALAEFSKHEALWTARLNLAMEINGILNMAGIDREEFWARPTLAQTVAQAQSTSPQGS